MKKVKTLIIRTAGTNCDMETAYAFKKAGADVESVHINSIIGKKGFLDKFQILAIPGGFTYGDDIASGKVLANELKNKLKDEMGKFISKGKLVIGICNGFQVLVKMGLLPGIEAENEASLGLNNSGKFEDRWVHLTKDTENKDVCVWTKDLPETIYVPVAHAEGKFITKNSAVLKKLKKNGQIVFRYSTSEGKTVGYPGNPNGSIDDIAGVCDPTGRILGMMPHPERHLVYTQHPNWRRLSKKDKSLGIGLHIFKNGVEFVKGNL